MNVHIKPKAYGNLLNVANENNISVPALIALIVETVMDTDSDNLMFYTEEVHQFSKTDICKELSPTVQSFKSLIDNKRNS